MVQTVPTANFRRVGLLSVVLLMSVPVVSAADTAGRSAEGDLARRILGAAEAKAGLIVHLGCGDGRLTAALHAGGSSLIHGLDTDAEKVRQAREYIQQQGIYGPVSVERFDGKRLPYADNLVNLLVAEDVGGVTMDEAMRVLAPGGAVCAEQDGRWEWTIKPRPENIDEWTHYLHDASGNAVAHDEVVGPPRRLQWVAEPRHTRSHEHTPGIHALVSAGGRIFYIVDQAPTSSMLWSPRWHLVARDAFNGVLLWKQPITTWWPHICGWTQGPQQLQRKLVAVGDRVYVTLGFHAPLTAVDAATGETLEVYDQTRGTEEIIWHNGILLLAVRSVTDERTAELEKWAQLSREKESPLHARETVNPLLKQLRAVEGKAEMTVLALDADAGRVLWKRTGADVAGLRPLSLCTDGDRAFYHTAGKVVCLDLKTGAEQWSAPAALLRLVDDGRVICASSDGKILTSLSAETGETQWTQEPSLTSIRDVFVAGGSLWIGGFKPYDTKTKWTGPAWGPYFATQRDLATGEMLKHIEPENPGHHHRCYSNKATDRYILGGRRGTEFIDLETGDVLWHSWARGVCRYGVMPCNGLLYTPPHACGCYIAAKLTGFSALASGPAKAAATSDEAPKPERGPAYDSPPPASRSTPSEDWPTYRYDARRSGCTPTSVPAVLRRKWQAEVGEKLTSPTVADGKVFVASVDEHRLCAIDADSGQPAWHFTAGARVDSPPTVQQDRAIFGCRDGYVYSVRASDGALAWRVRAARDERRITARGQLESVSPVHGSVLIDEGVAYLTAGRSSYLDGGIDLCRLEPRRGEVLSRTSVYSPDPETGRQPPHSAPSAVPGARADILTADDSHVYLRDMVFDRDGNAQPEGSPHLFTLTDFLDDSWTHRSYWILGTRPSISTGCSGRAKNLVYGRLLVFDDTTIYGYGRKNVHWSNQLQDGAYRVFAVKRGEQTAQWEQSVPLQVRAMVLAGDVLFVAGLPTGAGDPTKAPDGGEGALLIAISASDGAELARCELESSPAFDGMAAANGRLYLATTDGKVVCLAGDE